MELTFSVEEWELLLEILEERHSALQREIFHSDHREFKLALRRREKLLESVVHRLKVMQPVLEAVPELRR